MTLPDKLLLLPETSIFGHVAIGFERSKAWAFLTGMGYWMVRKTNNGNPETSALGVMTSVTE